MKPEKMEAHVLILMRAAALPGDRWAAYQNVALGHSQCGHMQALVIGPTRTFGSPPATMPDTDAGLGWRYRFAGWVNLDTGEVEPEQA